MPGEGRRVNAMLARELAGASKDQLALRRPVLPISLTQLFDGLVPGQAQRVQPPFDGLRAALVSQGQRLKLLLSDHNHELGYL